MNLFIDTNIYLNFIRSSEESIKSLEELERLVGSKSLSLVFPKITYDEFLRNAPLVAKEQLEIIGKHTPNKPPPMATSVRDKKVAGKVERTRKGYIGAIEDLKKGYLKSVDEVRDRVGRLFAVTVKAVAYDEFDLLGLAERRKKVGNPPGKRKDPIGDELVWEILLSNHFDDDLSVVAYDSDWADLLLTDDSNAAPHPLLLLEWKAKSRKGFTLYKSLRKFINAFTKEEKFSEEDIKEEQREGAYVGAVTSLPTISMHMPVEPCLVLGSDIVVPSSAVYNGNYIDLNVTPRCIVCGGTLESTENNVCKGCTARII